MAYRVETYTLREEAAKTAQGFLSASKTDKAAITN